MKHVLENLAPIFHAEDGVINIPHEYNGEVIAAVKELAKKQKVKLQFSTRLTPGISSVVLIGDAKNVAIVHQLFDERHFEVSANGYIEAASSNDVRQKAGAEPFKKFLNVFCVSRYLLMKKI
uniref:Uncharacterized protein n=1 Tax=Panagrolaimus superbus TaxID=310955 RepID=A0A914Z255_9BILA